MLEERVIIDPVSLSDVRPDQFILMGDTDNVIEASTLQSITPLSRRQDVNVYAISSWMPPPPPGVDETKWALVVKQLEAIHSLLEEANQEFLGAQAIINLMDETTVTTRKLGVELESISAAVRRSVKKTVSS